MRNRQKHEKAQRCCLIERDRLPRETLIVLTTETETTEPTETHKNARSVTHTKREKRDEAKR
jgi:hypothetical protein